MTTRFMSNGSLFVWSLTGLIVSACGGESTGAGRTDAEPTTPEVDSGAEPGGRDGAMPDTGAGGQASRADAGPACTPGALGCVCRDGACDDDAVCDGRGVCAEAERNESGRVDRRCFSPCTEGLSRPDGTYLPCDSDGLMQTCFGDEACIDGSCLPPGATKPRCESDAECPTWQACIGGACYSNCVSDADCGGETPTCAQRVCRQPCVSAGGTPCPRGTQCALDDGSTGVCMPTPKPAAAPVEAPEVDFALSAEALAFTTRTASGSLTLTNTGSRARTYTVTKLEHSSLEGDRGRTVVTTNPLFWVSMGVRGQEARVASFSVQVEPGQTVELGFSGVVNEALVSWSGLVSVRSDANGDTGGATVSLDFDNDPTGQWRGAYHTFINFEDRDLQRWIDAAPDDKAVAARRTNNAFIVKWQQFRQDQGGVVTSDELRAAMTAMFSGDWDLPTTKAACLEAFPNSPQVSCFLYAAPESANGAPESGVRVFSDDNREVFVPSGHLEMPFALNIAPSADAPGEFRFQGRVVTELALQYPNSPPVELFFEGDPSACEDPNAATCVQGIKSLAVTSRIGGRFMKTGDDCAPDGLVGFELDPQPWLVPDFVEGTEVDPETERRFRAECRASSAPLSPDTPERRALNRSAAGANPMPDGRARTRRMELIDGVLVNQSTMWLLVKEEFEGFLDLDGGEGAISAYGLVVLDKVAGDLKSQDFEAGLLPDLPAPPAGLLSLTCDPQLVEDVVGDAGAVLGPGTAEAVVTTLITGVSAGGASQIGPNSDWAAHVLCHDTGRFDGGRAAWAADDQIDDRCPAESRRTYFLVLKGDLSEADVRENACQGIQGCPANGEPCHVEGDDRRGSCGSTLEDWIDQGLAVRSPTWRCADANSVFCDDPVSADPRVGKVFFEPRDDGFTMTPFDTAVSEAFRYKTQFRNRSGAGVGFVPVVCQAGALTPYCYDPPEIEALRGRMDCLLSIFGSDLYDDLTVETRTLLKRTITEQFSVPPRGTNEDGFERLYAELLIMLGDDAATRALGSRFDLAGSAIGAFEGDKFEPDGLSLSGGAGYEMRLLYQATQSYRLVVDRFHRMASLVWRTMGERDRNFITADAVARYLDRVMLASTKVSKLASEKVERYLRFNRPDVARRVVERDYPLAYLEGTFFSKFLRRYLENLGPARASGAPQVNAQLEATQLKYGVALNRLRETYATITDEQTIFGFAPDYVPFVPLDPLAENAVRTLIDRALDTMGEARQREDAALASTRAFDTDAAQFQSELVRIRNQYENQLASVCGTMETFDDRVVPAIAKYKNNNATALVFGEPCGLMGTGDIAATLAGYESARLDVDIALRSVREVHERVAVEEARVEQECAGRVALGELEFDAAGQIVTLNRSIATSRQEMARAEREMARYDRALGQLRQVVATVGAASAAEMACMPPAVVVKPWACGASVGAAIGQGAIAVAQVGVGIAANLADEEIDSTETNIADKEQQAANLRRTAAFDQAKMECCLDGEACTQPGPIVVNSQATVERLLLDLTSADLALLRADLAVRQLLGRISSLRAQAQRLLSQQAEAEQLAIKVQSARNDPNIRLFKNAAVEDADKSFKDALEDAYRATVIVEYYTQQSYPDFQRLYLARMVGRGEDNLENYIYDLQRFYRGFEEQNGAPALRVLKLSLKYDILGIDKAETTNAQAEAFRRELVSPEHLAGDGTLSFDFSTNLDLVSPQTAIHKIDHVEVNIAADRGDGVGRVYLTQRGTGLLVGLDGERQYRAFPELTTVVNAYFGGVKSPLFDPELYTDERLRDRPLLNTLWTLGLNLDAEVVNRDIDLTTFNDIEVFIFYRDFARVL